MKKIIFFFLLLILAAVPVRAREEKQERIELKATNAATIRNEYQERIRTRLEEFKAKLGLIKDERKQKIAERINTQLAHLNKQITTHFTNVLTRLRALMDKLTVKIDQAKTDGLDTSKAEELMTLASAAIVKAEEAVKIQVKNEYVIEFTDESGLKVGASTAKQQLKTDLEAVRELVKAARQSVVDVLQELEAL
ncbi:MAG: hypothetical protein V1810_01760 [Candidatus Beckwithbacteria bacterium]